MMTFPIIRFLIFLGTLNVWAGLIDCHFGLISFMSLDKNVFMVLHDFQTLGKS